VRAPSIEQALLVAGEGARVVFPIDAERYFGLRHGEFLGER
jgi:hypothetical protein